MTLCASCALPFGQIRFAPSIRVLRNCPPVSAGWAFIKTKAHFLLTFFFKSSTLSKPGVTKVAWLCRLSFFIWLYLALSFFIWLYLALTAFSRRKLFLNQEEARRVCLPPGGNLQYSLLRWYFEPVPQSGARLLPFQPPP